MKAYQDVRKHDSVLRKAGWLVLLAASAGLTAVPRTEGATNLMVWDTMTRFTDTVEVADAAGWKPVPRDLLALEADPLKAASDPGYYGRAYSFKGDVVVENNSLTAVFWSAKGRVVLYSKAGRPGTGEPRPASSGLGTRILEFVPLQLKTQPASISRCEIVRNAGDEVALEVFFSAQGSGEVSGVFVFGRTEIVEIKPAEQMKGISLLTSLEYGVVPSFIGDDLIVDPAQFPSANTLFLPSENFFLGMLPGEGNTLVMTWPKGSQRLKLSLGQGSPAKRRVESVDFENGGQSLYLAALGAPGIWHQEELKPAYLEKEVVMNWKKPFAAKWKTQLDEAGVKTTFTFRESKSQIWRGVPGSYNYPVWFNGADALCQLSKKVPPKGAALIYFLEGQETPLSVSTPVDILKATLGRPDCDPILDRAGRKLRTHHRRGESGVRRACTCGCTDAIQAIFEEGEEVARKEEVEAALGDMNYFVQQHVARIDEYRRSADALIEFLRAKKTSAPELESYLESLEQIARKIPQEYSVQKENMGSPEYATQLTRRTLALTGRKDPNNLQAFKELLKAWRSMGGAQDYALAQCHTVIRQLFQEAGDGGATQPTGVVLAEEIRARCRQVLRNPDGYEIWADY